MAEYAEYIDWVQSKLSLEKDASASFCICLHLFMLFSHIYKRQRKISFEAG